MKNAALFLSLSLMTSLAFARDCKNKIWEHYNLDGNYVKEIRLESKEGSTAVYSVLGNLQGGDFKDEATVNVKTCEILEIHNIWAE